MGAQDSRLRYCRYTSEQTLGHQWLSYDKYMVHVYWKNSCTLLAQE